MTECIALAKGWRHSSGYRAGCRCRRCKDGWAEAKRIYRAKRPDVVRRIRLKSEFGLEPGEYEAMLETQDGVCAACGYAETANNQYGLLPLAVDHDHKTGRVRGLLCMRCNAAAGQLQDDPQRALGLAEYLTKVSA